MTITLRCLPLRDPQTGLMGFAGIPAFVGLLWVLLGASLPATGQVLYSGDLAVQVAPGLNPPIPHHGNPIAGGGVAVVGGGLPPQDVMLPPGFFTTGTSLIAPPAPGVPVDSRITTFMATAGTFSAGGGPGNLIHPAPGGQAQVMAGASQFGGTLQLLGSPSRKLVLTGGPSAMGTVVIPFSPIGGMNGGTATAMTPWTISTAMGFTFMTSLTVTVTGFEWTTGAVTASLGGAVLQATGFDNRTANGLMGSLQVVTPALVHINSPVPLPLCADGGGGCGSALGGIPEDFPVVLTMPEPGTTSLLMAGAAFLLAMVRRRRP